MAGDQVETPAKSPRGARTVIAHDFSLIADLQTLYRDEASEPTFVQILHHITIDDDAKLADLIEADGRLRIRLAKSVNLERYIDAVPDLPTRPDALDAAIDMSMRRALVASSMRCWRIHGSRISPGNTLIATRAG